MIITTGRIIKVHALLGTVSYRLERSSDSPGHVRVSAGDNNHLYLPGDLADAELFIAAYRRALDEAIDYKKEEVE